MQEALRSYPDIDLIVLAMILFLMAFALVLSQVWGQKKKEIFKQMEVLPLSKESAYE